MRPMVDVVGSRVRWGVSEWFWSVVLPCSQSKGWQEVEGEDGWRMRRMCDVTVLVLGRKDV